MYIHYLVRFPSHRRQTIDPDDDDDVSYTRGPSLAAHNIINIIIK